MTRKLSSSTEAKVNKYNVYNERGMKNLLSELTEEEMTYIVNSEYPTRWGLSQPYISVRNAVMDHLYNIILGDSNEA